MESLHFIVIYVRVAFCKQRHETGVHFRSIRAFLEYSIAGPGVTLTLLATAFTRGFAACRTVFC